MNRRRKLRRYGGLLAAAVAASSGLLLEAYQLLAWVVFTAASFIVHVAAWNGARRTVKAVAARMTDGSLTAYQLAEMAAERINAENHRTRELWRLYIVTAMLIIGVTAVLGHTGFVAPLLFFIVALTLLNSAIDQLERRELKEALRNEIALAKEES